MRPVYVCQLPRKEQEKVRRLLEDFLLYTCGGDKAAVQHYYGMRFEEAVQNGMDSKIADLDCLMAFYRENDQNSCTDEPFCLTKEWER